MKHFHFSRRELLQLAAGMVFIPEISGKAMGRGTDADRLDDLQVVRMKASPFALEDVTLLDGPFKEAMQRDGAYLLKLDPDRFLYYFRVTAGLQSKAPIYGGWEAHVGRMLGHYLSACSMMYASTRDQQFLGRVTYVVSQIGECQRANGDGYVGGIPEGKRLFIQIAAGEIEADRDGLNGVHAPWYMMHKLFAGLRDAHLYCGSKEAKGLLMGLADWACKLLANLSDAQFQKMLACEHGGMNEVLADVYALTGDRKYLVLAERFNHKAVLDPLMRRQDDLTGLHANTQLAKLVGLARLFEVTGKRNFRTGAMFFWEEVAWKRSYVTGGDSDHEDFFPIGDMGQHLSVGTAETCNAYNMLKLTRHLFCWDARAGYADFYERALYHHILGSQDPETGMMTYYYSLKPGHFKTFSTPFDSFWCCVGTGMENHSKYGESIYFHNMQDLYVNLFIASELDWKDQGLKIRQETNFPDEHTTRLVVSCNRPVEANVCIRHPQWATAGLEVAINGKRYPSASKPGSYLKIRRVWRNGDAVQGSIPMELHLEPMPDDPAKTSILYGPIVLAGMLGTEGYQSPMPYAGDNQKAYAHVPDPDVPALVTDGRPVSEYVQQVANKPLNFTLVRAGRASGVPLMPVYSANHERYTVYWDSRRQQGSAE
ncbi:MAG: beta-L-arabinofuranosidase domain-containing protein [Terriglobia bacterium]|jgi:hypothetical protein